MAAAHPYYRRRTPAPQAERDFAGDGTHIDFSTAHLPPYGTVAPVEAASSLFDRRAAAVVRAAVAIDGSRIEIFPDIAWGQESQTTVKVTPNPWALVGFGPPVTVDIRHTDVAPRQPWFRAGDFLEFKWYGFFDAPAIVLARSKCLAAMAYLDYFPERGERGRCLRALVSAAVSQANAGWCGTFGPNITDLGDEALLHNEEGNYDMAQMALVPLAYQYFAALSPAAREHLVTVLLAQGRIRRPGLPDAVTSGPVHPGWSDAGTLAQGETENHVLMILTTRYLTNQLLYQRTQEPSTDNRRNATGTEPSCLELVLALLRNFLVDDFSEYNAKSYSEDTRWALLNLCTYAYDHEVRLAARMVLDYVSARIAVSSNDLRRMVPFRRRNEGQNIAHSADGFMEVGLLDWESGADRMTQYFAVQAGNLRAFEHGTRLHRFPWGVGGDGQDLAIEVLSDYRLPRLIHDLFVNDAHRRFYQRLRRVDQAPGVIGRVAGGSGELNASSPSYLITAGGEAATYAIDPERFGIVFGDQAQQVGVGVTTSFMPTGWVGVPAHAGLGIESSGLHIGADPGPGEAHETVQFGAFTSVPGETGNYGVAPDFACGHRTHLPEWVEQARDSPMYTYQDAAGTIRDRSGPPGFLFVDRGSPFGVVGRRPDGQPTIGRLDVPGFYLAIYQETEGGPGVLEAYDTWLHPEVTFANFKASVLARNGKLRLADNVGTAYVTHGGTSLELVIWQGRGSSSPGAGVDILVPPGEHPGGSRVVIRRYGGDPQDGQDSPDGRNDAGKLGSWLVNGTVMNGRGDGRVDITNPFMPDRLILDLTDAARPKRTLNGVTEEAGANQEVWVNFAWSGPSEGDVYRPFTSLPSATAAVAPGGVINVVHGGTGDRSPIGSSKPMTIGAPFGSVVIGGGALPAPLAEDLSWRSDAVWLDFHWTGPDGLAPDGDVLRPYDNVPAATAGVASRGVVNIMPGDTHDRRRIGTGKPLTLSAPLGHVIIGRALPPAVPQPGGLHPL